MVKNINNDTRRELKSIHIEFLYPGANIRLHAPANTSFNQHTPTIFMYASKSFVLYNFFFCTVYCNIQ
jgi:hypothetical protein